MWATIGEDFKQDMFQTLQLVHLRLHNPELIILLLMRLKWGMRWFSVDLNNVFEHS